MTMVTGMRAPRARLRLRPNRPAEREGKTSSNAHPAVIVRQRVRPMAGPMTSSGGRSSKHETRICRAVESHHNVQCILDAPPSRSMTVEYAA